VPDTLVNLTSAAEPTSKARKPIDATTSAIVQSEATKGLARLIWDLADKTEVGTRHAMTAFRLVFSVMENIDAVSEKMRDKGDDRLRDSTEEMYLLLGQISEAIDEANKNARKMCEAGTELRPFSGGNEEELVTLRLQLKAAEDALNATDNDEPPLIEAYHQANDRFLDAPARTPADVLLKLERLADLGDMASDPGVSTNRIVLNLIRDLRAGLGINGQVQ
jgi:hypothetical protein